MKFTVEVSEEFLKGLKRDMASGVLVAFMVDDMSKDTMLSICMVGAAAKGKQEITKKGNPFVSVTRIDE